MGIVMTLGPLGGVSGPVLGGLLIEHAGWPMDLLPERAGRPRRGGDRADPAPAGTAIARPRCRLRAEVGLFTMAAAALMLSLTSTAEHGPAWLLLGTARP